MELNEILETFNIKVKKADKKEMSKYSLYELLNNDIELSNKKLQKILSSIKKMAILFEETKLKEMTKISSPIDVVDFLKVRIGHHRNEEFLTIYLDSLNKILDIVTVSEGTVNRSAVYTRKVVEQCIKLNATSVIIAHNHPAGSLTPSQNDIIATDNIKKALKLIDVRLLDHIILTNDNFFSFDDHNII